MVARRIVSYPRRGEVYLVNFDPTLGAEIKKTRPALVLQNDIGNRYSPLTIVAAITSHLEERLYPHQVLVIAPEGGMKKNSTVARKRNPSTPNAPPRSPSHRLARTTTDRCAALA